MTAPATDPVRAHLDTVYAAFLEVLETGLQPTLTSTIQTGNNWRQGEYDIVIDQHEHGLLHEQLQDVLAIADRHGGRVWIGQPDQKLSILFPYTQTPGPGEESPAEGTRRRSRTPRKKVAA